MNFIKDILLNPNPFINKKKDSDFFLPFLCLFAFTFSINLSSFANFCKPPQVADTIFVYDTIYVKEVVRDTVVINIYGKDITKEKNNNKIKPKKFKYSIDFLLATGITETSFSGKGRYDQNIALKKSAISLLPGFSSSIMFNYNFKKKHKFQIGLCFTEIREKFNYKSEAFDIKSTWSYLYYNTIVQKIDTIWFLDIDQLLHGDSVWVPYLYQYNTIKKDSIYSEKIDSTKLFYHDDIVNKYYYFEIPLIYGYFKIVIFIYYIIVVEKFSTVNFSTTMI